MQATKAIPNALRIISFKVPKQTQQGKSSEGSQAEQQKNGLWVEIEVDKQAGRGKGNVLPFLAVFDALLTASKAENPDLEGGSKGLGGSIVMRWSFSGGGGGEKASVGQCLGEKYGTRR